MSELQQWVRSIAHAYSIKKGIALSRLLNPKLLIQNNSFLNSPQATQELIGLAAKGQIPRFVGVYIQSNDDLLSTVEYTTDMCANLIRTSQPGKSATTNDMENVVKLGNRVLLRVLNLLDTSLEDPHSNNWLMPLLLRTCQFLIAISAEADELSERDFTETQDDGDTTSCGKLQQEVLNAMRQHIGKCQRSPEKANILVVLMAQSIQRCIALGNLKLAGQFTKTMNVKEFIDNILRATDMPRGPVVTFVGSIGVLDMYNNSFIAANEKLAWALERVRLSDLEEKRTLADKLIVTRMRLGILPTDEKLNEYGLLDTYKDITQSLRSGNIRLFELAFERNSLWFMKQGTLLIVERLKYICYRMLLFSIVQEYQKNLRKLGVPDSDSRNYQISLDTLRDLIGPYMEVQDPDLHTTFDVEELGSILSSIIYMNLMKGYIAWQARKLVVSKKEAFPDLESSLREGRLN